MVGPLRQWLASTISQKFKDSLSIAIRAMEGIVAAKAVCTENLTPVVVVMKAAQDGKRPYHTGSLNRARNGPQANVAIHLLTLALVVVLDPLAVALLLAAGCAEDTRPGHGRTRASKSRWTAAAARWTTCSSNKIAQLDRDPRSANTMA